MGMVIEGKWAADDERRYKDGRFKRSVTSIRNWITADGSAGPSGEGGFEAEAGRYHLYVSLACPWAHRTLIYRRLKGLEELISLAQVHAHMGENGWSFEAGPGVIADTVNHADYMHQVYVKANQDYTGRASVPVLWDKKRETIVNNESAEIIRMFNSAFDHLSGNNLDFYPEERRSDIDALNERIYETVNNGVYRSGFARSQEAYEDAVREVFATLDMLEERLGTRRYLTGDQITEADWRLFPTILRFDPVYVGHFKCNLRRIVDYPNLSGYLRDLYQQPGIAETVDIPYTKAHYYGSHVTVNPYGVVPVGPDIDLDAQHGRARLA